MGGREERRGEERGGGVWDENRGCERHDILSWPQILQNLALCKTLSADPSPKRQETV